MKAAQVLPPLLAAATLLLIGANALPTAHRKHRLQERYRHLDRAMKQERQSEQRLRAEIDALANDPFYFERLVVETWRGVPEGAIAFDPTGDEHELQD